MRKLIIVLLTCFLLASAAQALELTNLRGEARQSIIELNAKAWEGDVNAQYYLGEIHYWQTGLVKQNVSEGLEFYHMAAEQDHVEACVRLAGIYIKGDSCGTPKNEAEAFKWYLKAAELGDGKAQIKTGEMYFKGQGTARDYDLAYKWFTAAANSANVGNYIAQRYLEKYADGKIIDDLDIIAEQAQNGDITAQYKLGVALWFGNNIDRNKETAMQLMLSAAIKGHTGAQVMLSVMDRESKNYAQAFMWTLQAAIVGDVFSQSHMGRMYFEGEVVTQDYDLAYKWFTKAVASGESRDNRLASFSLEQYYQNGELIRKSYNDEFDDILKRAEAGDSEALGEIFVFYFMNGDMDQAAQWYTKAMQQNPDYIDAEYMAAIAVAYYVAGDHEKQAREWTKLAVDNGYVESEIYREVAEDIDDDAEAIRWYKKAAALGNAEACYDLGWHYGDSYFSRPDYDEAFKWYQKAYDLGEERAAFHLARAYDEGRGVKRDDARAFELYQQSLTNERYDSETVFYLAMMYEDGRGTAKDTEKAMEMLQAAAKYDSNAALQLAYYYYKGHLVPHDNVAAYVLLHDKIYCMMDRDLRAKIQYMQAILTNALTADEMQEAKTRIAEEEAERKALKENPKADETASKS